MGSCQETGKSENVFYNIHLHGSHHLMFHGAISMENCPQMWGPIHHPLINYWDKHEQTITKYSSKNKC